MQEAFASALASWPVKGIPDNPGAWITTTAHRKLIDAARREQTRRGKHDSLLYETVAATRTSETEGEPSAMHFPDDRLRLIFTCCHPALNPEAQIALTLRTLGGLSTPEIAKAFLVPEPTIAQRLVRAKRKIQEARIPYQEPSPARPSRTPRGGAGRDLPDLQRRLHRRFRNKPRSRGSVRRSDSSGQAAV